MLDLLGRSTAVSHEDAFLQRYDALVLVALRVTDGDRHEAEDLVHEAFIRFTLVQPPLEEVQHLDAYLSRMLRNMYTSRIRRRQRAAETSLSILDYDTLDIGFHAIDTSRQLEVREALRAACEYGCVRKRSSKTGGVFLLRFFHGYLPSEVASLTRLSAAIVDALVFRARREVKVYVEQPDQLAFIGGRTDPSIRRAERAAAAECDGDQTEPGFLQELRARIFNDTHDRCWSKKALRDRYQDRSAEALSRDALADLVGCPVCLDAASALLGLPRLAERWPADSLGPGSRGGGPASGGPTAGGRASGSIAQGRRRARAIFEHRPRELCVSVNGFILGTHTIGAQDTDFTLSVNVSEPIGLVELLSEQGLCLLFLDISPPPDGNARQRRHVDLSDGRYAQIEVTFAGPWPTVRVSYGDPRPRHTVLTDDELAGEVEAAEHRQRVLSLPSQPRRLFARRPAWALALLALVVWLLFWTPGTTVSAAERIADTIKWLVGAVFGPSASTETDGAAPTRNLARDISLPAPLFVPAKPAGLSSARRTHLELEALAELQRVDAYLGQELSFAARDGSSVRLQATVGTKARRDALLRALGPLLSEPDLRARVTSLDEVAGRSPRKAPVAGGTHAFQFVNDEFPMFAAVRNHLLREERLRHDESGANGTAPIDDAELDSRTRRFAMALLDRSRRASQHAWALKHLGDRFPAGLLDAASPDTRGVWRRLVGVHARAYQQEMALLRRDLEPVIRTMDAEAPVRSGQAVEPPATDVWARVDRLLDAHRRQDEAIQHAFAVQAGAAGGVDGVQTSAFWQLVELCEALAAEIAQDASSGA